MKTIKNIIFDLGGVLINVDYKKTAIAFENLGIENFDDLFTQHRSNPLFEDLETGNITNEDFYSAFRKETNTTFSDEQIRDAWNAMILDFPKERIKWLDEISQRYNIFLFSNTNAIHYDCFQNIYTTSIGGKPFNDYFLKAYYSHTLGKRKPYSYSYKAILDIENLNAADTLFIDDTLLNIEGANETGLQTIHLKNPMTILDLNL